MDLNQLLTAVLDKKGTTLHLVAGSPPIVKLADGTLSPLENNPLSPADVKSILENALSADQKAILSQNRALTTAYSVEGLSRFRASFFYQRGSLAGIFRLVIKNMSSLEDLGLPPLLKDAAVKPQGLILIAGPRKSGKSQTLAALFDFLLSAHATEIVSLEEPIEFLLKNQKGIIYQREIGTDSPGFKEAIKVALRQNPDVLAISELPDSQSVMELLGAATSGQLVILTPTANSVLVAIEQLLNRVPADQQALARSQLANGLELGLSQLLLSKPSGGSAPSARSASSLAEPSASDGSGSLTSSKSLVLEILLSTTQIRTMIREGKLQGLVAAMNAAVDSGMITQEVSMKNLAKKNLINIDEAMSRAARPEELKRLLSFQI